MILDFLSQTLVATIENSFPWWTNEMLQVEQIYIQ